MSSVPSAPFRLSALWLVLILTFLFSMTSDSIQASGAETAQGRLLFESPVPFYHDYNLTLLHPVGKVSSGASAERKENLTLEECIRIALGRNQDYKIARENLRAAFGDMATAWGLFTPIAYANYAVNQNNQLRETQIGAGSKTIRFFGNASAASLGFSFNVFNQGQMYFEMRNAFFLRRERRSDLRGMELLVADNVRASYFEILRQQHLLKASEEQSAQLKEQLRQAEARLKVGEITKLDVLQARIDLQNEQIRGLEYRNLLAAARENLNLAVGGGLPEDYSLTDEFRVEEPVLDVDKLVEEALELNPQLISLELQYRQERNNLWIGRLAYMPTVKATVGYTHSGDVLFSVPPRDSRGSQVGMTFYWSILDGFERFKTNRYTQASANNLNYTLEKTRLEIGRDVRLGCLELQRLYEQHLTLAESRDLAAQSLELERKSYALGAANMVEVRKAQADFIQAEVNYINSIYDYHTALSALSRSVGRDITGYGK